MLNFFLPGLNGLFMSKWNIRHHPTYDRRYKEYSKKHPGILIALTENLKNLMEHLENDVPLHQCRFGWLHNEPKGIFAITEKGGHGKNLAPGRMYIYPDTDNRKMYLLTIGGKNKQSRDITFCSNIVNKIKEG